MKPLLMACALGLLAGCGFGADRSTPQGQCEAAAYNDPTVKDLVAKSAVSSPEAQQDQLATQKLALRQATNRCLAQKGLAPTGGVEAPRNANRPPY